MKTNQLSKRILGVVLVAAMLSGCASSKDYLSDNFARVKNTHQKIAILPFNVQFENKSTGKNNVRSQKFFNQQEREASLDAQKELFTYAAKQVQKGKYELAFQDFSRTNKTLSESGIPLEEIAQRDKGQLARLLGVDAVIWGELDVRVTRQDRYSMMPAYRGNDGVDTEVHLYDAASGEKLWATTLSQRPSSHMDTPHRLSNQLIEQIAKHLPYRTK